MTKMTKMTWLGSALAAGLCMSAAQAAAEPDGKAVFLEKKCSTCHSVVSAGIKPSGSKIKLIDLSDVASKRTAAWLTAYLEKTEKLEGKAHPPKFRGTPEELKAMVAWLMSLKPAP